MSDAPVLVTGASGFVGAQVLRALAGRAPAVAVARDPSRAPEVVRDAAAWHAADLAASGVAEELVRAARPRAVVHCMAVARAADCEHDPEAAHRANAVAAGAVALAASRAGARLVHVSTDLVFGAEAPPEGGFTEDDSPAPTSVYGATKREGEDRVLSVVGDAVVARLPLLFGDSLGRERGATDSLRAALARGERPTLFEDEWRTPLDVADAAAALVELALSSAGPRGLLHLAGPDRLSRLELGLLALEAAGVPAEEARGRVRAAPRAALPMTPPRPGDCSLDASRARALLRTELRAPADALRRA